MKLELGTSNVIVSSDLGGAASVRLQVGRREALAIGGTLEPHELEAVRRIAARIAKDVLSDVPSEGPTFAGLESEFSTFRQSAHVAVATLRDYAERLETKIRSLVGSNVSTLDEAFELLRLQGEERIVMRAEIERLNEILENYRNEDTR